MNAVLRRPLCLFGLLTAGAFALALATHGFHAHTEPDSTAYLEFDWSSTSAVLSGIRTWGYPLFLRLVLFVTPNLNAVAVAHWLCWLAAAGALYCGLVHSGGRRDSAAVAAGLLLFGQAALTFTPAVLADSLATSLSVCSAGAFLATNVRGPRRRSWCLLALTTAAAWLVRPACLFLIPLWPLLSVGFASTLLRRDLGWSGVFRRGLTALLATTVPFVAYCTLRWAVVGHWGLVSFGGYNIIGIAAQFLEDADVEQLSPELQPLARELIRRRALRTDITPPTDFLSMENSYPPAVWQWTVPTTRDVVGGDVMQVNAVLNQLSAELLRLHRRDYARWLAWNAKHAVHQALDLTCRDRGVLLLGLLVMGAHFWSLLRGRPPGVGPTATDDDEQQEYVQSHLLLWTALSFAAAKTLLVILVEPAIGRYMMAATVLFPCVLAQFAVRCWRNPWRCCDVAANRSESRAGIN